MKITLHLVILQTVVIFAQELTAAPETSQPNTNSESVVVVRNAPSGGECYPSAEALENALERIRNTTEAIFRDLYMQPCGALIKSQLFGGTQGRGSPFDDHSEEITGIVGMNIRHGSQIDAIQVTYQLRNGNTYETPMYGGNGGSLSSFTLAAGEKLVRMEGKTNGVLIDMLTFYSNTGNRYGPYGITGETPFTVLVQKFLHFMDVMGELLASLIPLVYIITVTNLHVRLKLYTVV